MDKRGVISSNPTAVRFPSRMLVKRAAQILVKDGWRIDIVDVQSGKHITELARDATAAKVDTFLLLEVMARFLTQSQVWLAKIQR